jgi:hypothetical protein
MAVHFIGFRGDDYWSAVRVWGLPDFYHRDWDTRAQHDVADGDVLIFSYKAHPDKPVKFCYDDSNQDGDPAAADRLAMKGQKR